VLDNEFTKSEAQRDYGNYVELVHRLEASHVNSSIFQAGAKIGVL